jgi:hypothetical protein
MLAARARPLSTPHKLSAHHTHTQNRSSQPLNCKSSIENAYARIMAPQFVCRSTVAAQTASVDAHMEVRRLLQQARPGCGAGGDALPATLAGVALRACMQMPVPAEVVYALLADPQAHVDVFSQIQVRAFGLGWCSHVHADTCTRHDTRACSHTCSLQPQGARSRLLREEGPRRYFELDYTARWRFWRVGGTCENRLWMDTDADAGTVGVPSKQENPEHHHHCNFHGHIYLTSFPINKYTTQCRPRR